MTSAEKRTILEDALDLGFKAIGQASIEDLKGEGFGRLFNNLMLLHSMRRIIPAEAVEPEQPDMAACSLEETEAPKESLEVPNETPAPETEESCGPAPTYTREEVKRALARARVKGVNVVAVLRQVGTDSFLTLTENKFAEVMKIIEQELANAS